MIKRLMLLALSCILSGTFSQAQTLKFGHINSTQLLSFMPETKAADSTIEKFGKSLESQLKTMTAEYQSKVQDYTDKEGAMADPVKKSKQQEINDLGNRIKDFQDSAQESIQKKKEELYSPVIKKAEDAIHSVAKEKAYSYIFDTSVGAVLYAQDSDDIMPIVKQKLGLK